jgi:hypothetical protein
VPGTHPDASVPRPTGRPPCTLRSLRQLAGTLDSLDAATLVETLRRAQAR